MVLSNVHEVPESYVQFTLHLNVIWKEWKKKLIISILDLERNDILLMKIKKC